MIFNFGNDPTIKKDLENLKKTVNTNSTDIGYLKYNLDDLFITLGGIERELTNLKSSINNQLISVDSRISDLESKDYSWTRVGNYYVPSNKGVYITPPIPLSEAKEIMLSIYNENSVIGSTTAAIDLFKNLPISVSVRDGSTVRTAMIQSTSDGEIFINNIENVSYVYIHMR